MADSTDLNSEEAILFPHQSLSQFSGDLRYTETTRYLCAAAHLQTDFRNDVIRQVVEEEHKAIGECIDVDVASVVKHCLAARRREALRNIALMVILLFFILFLITFQFKFCLLCLILVWVVVFFELWIGHFKVLARQLTRAGYKPDAINFQLDPNLEQKIRETQNANVVRYSSFTPFIGSGYPIGSWHRTFNITKGKQELEKSLPPLSFELLEMYEYLTEAIRELNIDGLSIKDKLYVHGEEIRDDQRFLAHPFARPRVQVASSLVRTFIEKPTHSIRYYKCLQVMPQKGELVLSIFLNFAKKRPYLHARAQYFLLPPLKEIYYEEIDAVHPNLLVGKIWQLLKESISAAPRLWILSPIELFKALLLPLQHQVELLRIRKQIRENRNFDYGATNSIRQDASALLQRRYFHKLDADMHLKIIERQILESTVEFLEMKNIDTTELKKQQTTILNSGLIITGGAINADSIAVGDQAKAETTKGDNQGGYHGQKHAE